MEGTPAGTLLRGRALRGLLAVGVVAAVAITVAAAAWSRGASDGAAPYHDAAVAGSIGLCDRAGHQVSSGSTTAAPFVWRAVGTTPADAGYGGPQRSATLFAFQPRAGATPDSWSGRMLTAAGLYRYPKHPTAAATGKDVALRDFLTGYPARDDGFVQLRLFLGAPGRPSLTTRYDALDIHVSGTTWHAVGGARVNCSTAKAVSFETVVAPSHRS
jgi:hypothetical protein